MQAGTAVSPGTNTKYNLTDLQHLYWIGHQLRPFATHFNNAFSFTFRSSLCPDWFAQAFGTAVCEFDALRTIFFEEQGVPQQCVLPSASVELAIVDLTDEPDPVAAAEQWQAVRVQRPFVINQCLYDTALLKLADDHFVWFLNQHHLITDASSFFLMAESVLGHYANLQQGTPQPPALRPPFSRYVASLEKQQQSNRADASRAFWQQKLAEKPEPLHFYGRSTRNHSHTANRWMYNLGTTQTSQLIAIAEAVDLGKATPEFRQFCLTATLYFALLHQLTGNQRLGFVTTIHNRGTQVNRQTVGVLMELCPVLVEIAPDDTFTTLMQKVTAEMRQLMLHYRYGASQAASDLALEAMFTFVQRPSLTFDGLPVTHKIIHHNTTSDSLALHIHHLADDNSYDLYLDLPEEIFNAAQMMHVQQSLQALIADLLANPDAQIAASAIPWPEVADDLVGNGRIPTQPTYQPPRTPTEGVLQQIWQDVLARAPIGIHHDFFDLGGESWQAMSFLSRLEAETGHRLPLSSLITSRTIAALAEKLAESAQAEDLLQLQAGAPNVTPIFFMPGAAGNTLAVARLAQQMSPRQPIYTFQMPLLDLANLPPADVPSLAEYYLQAIQAAQPHGPYQLGGYSAGGIFAYEVAQRLQAKGESVQFVAIIDMPAPNPAWAVWRRACRAMARLLRFSAAQEEQLYLFGRDWWNRATFFRVMGARRQGRRLLYRLRNFWRKPLAQKRDSLQQKLQPTPSEVAPSPQRPVLRDMDPSGLTDPQARALFELYDRAARNYTPAPYEGRITLLRCGLGYGRPEIRSPFPDYGWRKLAQEVQIFVMKAPGHLALMQEPYVAEVGQTIQAALQTLRV